MKVSHLLEKKTNQSMGGYIDSLLKQKIKKLGHGSFSNVFAHPSHANVAVKVFVADDWDYREWVKFAQKNQDNPYVPKIFGDIKFFEPDDFDLDKSNEQDFDFGGSDFGIVFMEKLAPMSVSQWKKFWKYASNESVTDHIHWATVAEAIIRHKKSDPDLVKVLKAIGDRQDIRRPNLMLRGEQVVFTDPMHTMENPFD